MTSKVEQPLFSELEFQELVAFRHELHRNPEVSGHEYETAQRFVSFLAPLKPDRIVTALGRTGVAVVFEGREAGPTVLFRCELDALPIAETGGVAYASLIPGKGHMCGHDGHMATMAAFARVLSRNRPVKGRAVLLFQPAEETGAGALAVLEDPAFEEIRPDLSFSLHNMPGYELGYCVLKTGPVNCASRGLRLRLTGRTAHASTPETGKSPMAAMARLMPELLAFSEGLPESGQEIGASFAMITVTHASLGEPTFGVAPGSAEIWATLRTLTDNRMDVLQADVETLVHELAHEEGLDVAIDYHDVFQHCENSPETVEHLTTAMADEGVAFGSGDLPMRGSEDFGRFRSVGPSAMFFLGAGYEAQALHSPDYDFPDELIPIGAGIFARVARNILG
ncbi:amidohydrolase [Brucella pecoris]|uniref:Amidohydrolase n=1 Tax=Brucella pecoris TaxID=867683 RepID=A0AB34YWK6_9HYPH|nr:amidohydrolase [Brucella pecoris]MBB4095619.1 amidohydrolase [Brucella pecoris]